MGYAVKPVKSRSPSRGGRTWRLLIEKNRFEGEKRIREYTSIVEKDYGLHGFHAGLTIEQAKERASLLNKSNEEKRHAERKAAITERIAVENAKLALSIPEEREFIAWCELEHRIAFKGPNKLESHWQAAKRCLADLGLLPPDYYDSRRRIYLWFQERTLSVEYLKKVLRFINLYGRFYAKRFKVFYEDVPYPTGKDKEEINDVFFDSKGEGKKAAPLTPAALEKAKGSLPEDQYRWMYLSLWLGLRPNEVDALKDLKRTRIETEADSTLVVWVYQSKLKGIARERRWKPIPLVEPEQACIPGLIEAGFKRPLVKTLKGAIGPQVNTYSGRKGFEGVMHERGHPFDHISQWLGHQSLDRTWKNYTDRLRVRRTKKAA